MSLSDFWGRLAGTFFVIFVAIGIIMLVVTQGAPSRDALIGYGVAAAFFVGGPIVIAIICAIWDA